MIWVKLVSLIFINPCGDLLYSTSYIDLFSDHEENLRLNMNFLINVTKAIGILFIFAFICAAIGMDTDTIAALGGIFVFPGLMYYFLSKNKKNT